jgi:hypothetical protein
MMRLLPSHVWYVAFTAFAYGLLCLSVGFIIGVVVADWLA